MANINFNNSKQNSTSRRDESENNLPYISPTPGEIPIIANDPFTFNSRENPEELKKEDIETVVECGFNIGVMATPDKFLNKILSLCPKTGFKMMPANSKLLDNRYQDFLNSFMHNPYIGGWLFIDEPPVDKFENYDIAYLNVTDYDTKHMAVINLAVSGKSTISNGMSMENYLNEVDSSFRPPVWSYDFYPIIIKNQVPVNRYIPFYCNFQLFSKKAKETNRPFWAFVLSMEHTLSSGAVYPAPKEEYMRYEAFTALAYGAQGILYWSYAQYRDTANATYKSALIDREGNKTEYWYYAQKVNAEIRKFTKVFLGATLTKYIHVGKLNPQDWELKPPVSHSNIGPIEGVTSIDDGAVITFLRNKNSGINSFYRFFIIVNHSPFEDSYIDIKFLSNSTVRELTNCKKDDFSDAVTMSTSFGQTMVIKPGAYRIFQYHTPFQD